LITSEVGSSIIIGGSSLPQLVANEITAKENATVFKNLKIDFFIFCLLCLLIFYK
jgi:hypothetical protein